MFKFLKNKIQEAVKKFSKNTKAKEEEVEVEKFVETPTKETPVEETPGPEVPEKPLKDEPISQPQEDPKPADEVEQVPQPLDEVETKEIETKELVEETVEEPEPAEDEGLEPKSDDAPEVIEMVEPEVEPQEVIEDISIPESVSEFVEPVQEDDSKAPSADVADLFESQSDTSQDVKDDVDVKAQVEEVQAIEESIPQTKEEQIEESLEEDLKQTDVDIDQDELQFPTESKKPGFFKRLFNKKEDLVEPDSVSPVPAVSKDEDVVEELADDVVAHVQVQEESKVPQTPDEPMLQATTKSPASDLLDDVVADATKKKKGFFTKLKEKIVRFQLTEEKFEEIFWDFELALMENNVALEVIEKVKKDMHDQLTKENISRKSVEEVILDTLKQSLDDVLTVPTFDFINKVKTKKPFVIAMVGVNGSGKTTTLAKIIHHLQKNNLSVVVAASDTFRAAAIQQLEEHTNKLGVKLIKHDYNADPSAVAYDAIAHAKAKDIDVVLIDTAGRLQSNSNLMDELKKLIRVNTPDLNIFIGESVTGNDCVEQAMAFNEAVGIDGIILSKADIDEKGGAAISVSYVTKKPILYIGTGQTYDDLKPFKKEEILANLGL